MVRVMDTVGSGLAFTPPAVSPGTTADFYEEAPGNPQPMIVWNAALRTFTWEISDLQPGEANARTYHLRTTIGSGSCENPADRRNSVVAEWHCATGIVDQNPGTDESLCTAGTVSASLEAEVTPVVNVGASVTPTAVGFCTLDTVMSVDIEVPATSNNLYNLFASVTLPAGMNFHQDADFKVSTGPAAVTPYPPTQLANPIPICGVAPCIPTPAEGVSGFTLDLGSVLTNGQLQAGQKVRITFNVKSSCFSGGSLNVQLAFEDCCGNDYAPTPFSTTIAPDYPDLDVRVERVPNTSNLICPSNVAYNVVVTNTGSVTATYAQVRANLSSWLSFISATDTEISSGGHTSAESCDPGGACGACAANFSNGDVLWELDYLAPGATWRTTLNVAFDQPASVDCDNVDRELTASVLYGCPADMDTAPNPLIDFNACSNEADGCGLSVGDAAVDRYDTPDLAIINVVPTYACGTDGRFSGSLVAQIRNLGNNPANKTFTVRLEDGNGWSGAGVYNGVINPGQTVDVTIDTTGWVADCHACEQYTFSGVVDVGDQVCECNEANNTFGPAIYEPCAAIGDTVWHDRNQDGIQDVGEEGIRNVTVYLYNPGPNGAAGDGDDILIATTTTDSSGYYDFTGLAPGDYFVRFDKSTAPNGANLIATTQDVSSNSRDIEDSDANPTTGRTIVTTLVNGEFDMTWDAGFYYPGDNVSLGNRVWFDNAGTGSGIANNGVQDGDEPGIDGVRVNLFNLLGNQIATTVTHDNGFYLFDNLPQGEYIVEIDRSNFAPGGPLYDSVNSQPYFSSAFTEVDPNNPTNPDNNDNGLDQSNPAATGVRSGIVSVFADTEPTGESPLGPEGYGTAPIDDNNANATVDFGFTTQTGLSLGNRVWLDNGAGGGTIDDGVRQPGEPVVAGVLVQLLDNGGNPVLDSGGQPMTTTTDANGFYLFDGLLPGTYTVQIAASNFAAGGALYNTRSSAPEYSNDTDNQDKGQNAFVGGAIQSAPFVLTVGGEPTDEDASDSSGTALDADSNLTVDFGFVPLMSLGNRVWGDANNNGVIDGAETGIDGVMVELFKEITPGNYASQGTDSTTNGGFYNFDNLLPGNYYVHVLPTNFTTGPLQEYFSSTTAEANPNDNGDRNDNGIDNSQPGLNGIISNPITLAYSDEPVGEEMPNNAVDADANTNFTLDFGFYEPVSLGNRVWLDDNYNGQDDGELAAANVVVNLLDSSGNFLATTTTNAQGYYLFDYLLPGDYIVEIAAGNFQPGQPLFGRTSTLTLKTDPDLNNNDQQDNGLDHFAPETSGIRSAAVTLTADNEPTGETTGGLTPATDDNNANLTVDFGFAPAVTLGNRVWLDLNDDGVQNPSENGIPNVALSLFYGDGVTPVRDEQTGVNVTTTTDANGYYIFRNLRPDSYVVRVDSGNFGNGQPLDDMRSSTMEVTDPNADQDDLDDNGINDAPNWTTNGVYSSRTNPVTLLPDTEPTADADLGPYGHGGVDNDNSNLTIDFGFVPRLALGNRVWNDLDNDGQHDAGESGIDGVTVNLVRASDNTVVATTITNPQGYYLFENLLPGDYIVEIPAANFDETTDALSGFLSSQTTETDPNLNTPAIDQNDNGLDQTFPETTGIRSGVVTLSYNSEPDANDLNDGIAQTNPAVDDNNTNFAVDFGFFEPVSLGNRVWFDANFNGLLDGAEAGVDGVQVNLLNAAGDTVLATTYTQDGGYYLFDRLTPGTYIVEIAPGNFSSSGPLYRYTSTVTASPSSDPDANATDSDDNGLDDYRDLTIDLPGKINDTGIRSNPITLLTPSTALEPTGETDLQPVIGDGYPADDHANMTVDFGFVPAVSVGNRVWWDDGAGGGGIDNGILDGSEQGAAGVTVNLLYADGSPVMNQRTGNAVSTVTDGSGYYLFDHIVPGDYIVEIVPPANTRSSTGKTGPEGDVDSDDSGDDNTFRSDVVQLRVNSEPTNETDIGGGGHGSVANASSNLTVDFGLVPLLSLGNRVWFDDNGNGVQDGAELGIENVVVELLDGSGNPINGGTFDTTDSDGYYRFDNLIPGNYKVRILADNFNNSGDPLYGYFSAYPTEANPNANGDLNDNGIDNITPADPVNGGIYSGVVTLSANSEPLGEPGDRLPYDDNDSNLTVDFGFTTGVSLGNRVWHDNGADGGTANNGIRDGNEPGIPNVTLRLLYPDGTPVQIGGSDVTDETDANGYYLFENIPPGQYIVEVMAQEFATGDLVGYNSSGFTEVSPDANVDINDNGVNTPVAGAIRSGVVTVTPNNEPTGEETAVGPDADASSNLTVDFGFVNTPRVSLGNRVWFDSGFDDSNPATGLPAAGVANNGIHDGDEPGAANVLVELLSGGAVFMTTTTDANGFYLFDGIPEGDYQVRIAAGNFLNGGPLANTLSSLPAFDPENNTDQDDNGVNNPTPVSGGVTSGDVILTVGGEPTNVSVPAEVQDGITPTTPDADNNRTVDFGFVPLLSLGNRVWLDTDLDGLRDATENGIADVIVNLRRTSDNALVATTTTDANGYYLFDNLYPGTYYVEIPAENFIDDGNPANPDPLLNLTSSVPTESLPDRNDNNDNGLNVPSPATTGVRSYDVVLQHNSEPTTETDIGPQGTGNADNDNSNLTVDFGFIPVEPMSLGNRVWRDNGATVGHANNGVQDTDEAGLDLVWVRLLDSSGAQAVDITGALVAPIQTSGGGYYRFDNLAPGDYIVEVQAVNFGAGGALNGLYSTAFTALNPNTDQDDEDDNGIDQPNPSATGIRSGIVSLNPNTEPTGEDGEPGVVPDNDSNLTVDFGFNVQTVSLGNRVWLDNGAGTFANANNGVMDAGEAGIAGVIINLRDSSGNLVATTTTDANGYYLFDSLPPGQYYAQIDPSNFAPAGVQSGMISSIPTETDPDTNIDRDDNGLNSTDRTDLLANGIRSNLITLQPDTITEPTDDDDLGPEQHGTTTDERSNLTLDFGFFEPVSLGNRVWYDVDNDGVHDAAETGISGVTVNLLDTANNVLATTTTNADGFYLFENLAPGDYVVQIAPENFDDATGLLRDAASSPTNTTPDADRNDDGNNPADLADVQANGVKSNVITLTPDGEPTTANGETQDGITPAYTDDNNTNRTVDFGFVPRLSLGNRIWLDNGGTTGTANNSVQDGDEAGINDVIVRLLNPNGTRVYDADGNLVADEVTANDGHYRFDNLLPGQYIVEILAENFVDDGDAGNPDPLYDAANTRPYYSSPNTEANPNADVDLNDNGIDDANPETNGVRSGVVTLALNSEPAPTGTTDDAESGPGDPGTTQDRNSNLSVDFGFTNIQTVSLGNRVWFDNGAGGGASDDGLRNGTEPGIPGVVVNLYRASDLGTIIATDTTDANGYYMFSSLEPGEYVVQIAPASFADGAVLRYARSSALNNIDPDNDLDKDDNGVNAVLADRQTNGIWSLPITVEPDTLAEPTNETELGPEGHGGVPNNRSNLTVDFGFVPLVSLGNRVWQDNDNDGVHDAGEDGIDGVTVRLLDRFGNPTGLTDTTANGGYYLFDNLAPGQYIVEIISDNFAAAGALYTYQSSAPTTLSPDTTVDKDDNGLNTFVNGGIRSGLVTLQAGTEPELGADADDEDSAHQEPGVLQGSVPDNSGNLTVDFGFVPTMSLGNRVWIDTDRDGRHDLPGESGVVGVLVNLLDSSGAVIATTTTGTDGYYRFDNLLPGDYYVEVDKSNFDSGNLLHGYLSSPTTTPDTDLRDRGVNNSNPAANGIRSALINLTAGSEPTGEEMPAGWTYPVDENTNFTIDFGFMPVMSLGNRVWYDANNNGVMDNGEQGIANVRVEPVE